MSVYFIYGWFCNNAASGQFIVVYSNWRVVIGGWFDFQKHKKTNLMSNFSPSAVTYFPGKGSLCMPGNPKNMYPLDNDIYLPCLWSIAFQTLLSEQHFVKMGSSPESTPAKRQESKEPFTPDKGLCVAFSPAKVSRFAGLGFTRTRSGWIIVAGNL